MKQLSLRVTFYSPFCVIYKYNSVPAFNLPVPVSIYVLFLVSGFIILIKYNSSNQIEHFNF